jgi:glycosyltransferase involved in cell wall biosynthesis
MARILHVVNSYFSVPYFIGGQFIYFKNKGHQIYLICSPSEYLESYSQEMGFSYKAIEITRTYSILKDISALYKTYWFIRKNKFDIVVGHTPKGALISMFAGLLCGTKMRIYFRHGLVYETADGLARSVLKLAEKVTSLCSTKIICVSKSLYNLSLKEHLNPVKKQKILGKGTCGGIDTINKFNPELIDKERVVELKQKYKIAENGIVIGFCGRLVRDKGIVELVGAFELLRHELTSWRIVLLLVGVLEERDCLPDEIIGKIKTDNDIVFTGFINNDIQYYYSLMNIYILPSYREGFGMSVIEASSMRIPVLTSKSTGCVDSIIENVTGNYIEITPESIAEGIKYFINNPDKASTFGRNGRNFVTENFDNLTIWKEMEQLYG